ATDVGEEVHAVDELHREEPLLAVGRELEQRAQVRMRDVRERPKLLLEAVEGLRRHAAQRLQRNEAVALAVVRLVDDSESARAEAAVEGETVGPPEFSEIP